MKHLLDLNDYCESWCDGSFSPEKVSGRVTVESGETLKMYEEEHTFF
jgi:methionyl-tRNA synthetase